MYCTFWAEKVSVQKEMAQLVRDGKALAHERIIRLVVDVPSPRQPFETAGQAPTRMGKVWYSFNPAFGNYGRNELYVGVSIQCQSNNF